METNSQDKALREALRRIDDEAQAAGFAADFEQRLMDKLEQKPRNSWLGRQVAAVFIAILLVSGMALAAVYLFVPQSSIIHHSTPIPQQPSPVTQYPATVNFENVALDSILSTVARHYQRHLVFTDDRLRQLRISTTWLPKQPLETFVGTLNELDHVYLSLQDDTIMAQPKQKEGGR